MGTINLTGVDGAQHQLAYDNGIKLMELLRDNDFVRAECGGMQICATCHVYLDANSIAIVGKADDGEAEMLDGTGDFKPGRSRLSCQVELTDACDGLGVTVAPAL